MNSGKFRYIRSADNPQYKRLKKLAGSARERRQCGQTLLDGVHLVAALADAGGQLELLALRAGSESDPAIVRCVEHFGSVPALVFGAALFDALSPVEHPTGILGLFSIPQPRPRRAACGVLLEAIQDPGNLGTILRTAAAAGVEAVYLSSGCAEAWSPKALRAGMGAHFALAIHEQQSLPEVAREFDAVLAAALDAAQCVYDVDLTGRVAFLFGNEGAGLSAAAMAAASMRVKIPMPGKIESLNVAAAAAVCLFERVRQLQKMG